MNICRMMLLCVCTHSQPENVQQFKHWGLIFPTMNFPLGFSLHIFQTFHIGILLIVGKQCLAKNPCEISAHSVSFRRFVRLVGFTTVAEWKSRWIIELKSSKKGFFVKKINHNSYMDLPEDKNLVEKIP